MKNTAEKGNAEVGQNEGAEMPQMPSPQPQTMMAFVVPADIFSQMVGQLDKLPRVETALLYKHIETLRPQQVNIRG